MGKRDYMSLALDLAKKALGRTSPNPLVGAVVVKEGEVIGTGYHHYAGGFHAEANVLSSIGEAAKGATMYVTLEPCSHYGKTPPCAKFIIESGIKKVVIAMKDPNPKVAGKGIKMLESAGIKTEVGLLKEEAVKLNEDYIKYMKTNTPFVILKNAMTLDGKIATKKGDSKWITGEGSREFVHRLRDRVDGILVGIGTVLADDPRLTTRLPEGGEDATRIVLDDELKIPLDAKLVTQKSSAPTIIATTEQADQAKKKKLKEAGVEVVEAGIKNKVDLKILLEELGKRELISLLVEGGSQINASFLETKLVDKLYYFIAPKIIGGREAIPVVAGRGVNKIEAGVVIEQLEVTKVDNDLLIIGYPKYK
ncbi:bifunctional diaminohydroxyphosphoribosylaminopyrimidine deaminase/5-amino-6-(5-phosphoribosylamino)uracil reductase RibD [Natroniella sp. ANB-PHB2]|uniref:bifunctional diaminohydroxyphosphoribosylaminopyrimidine deaminase/5-amino-6-(5-phosphoribosylamino)uracil reductase RibD n=1 Tax=Natroniella sp. ANB-PHB2 TaxID=3384444 RepID=UPI0038D4374F